MRWLILCVVLGCGAAKRTPDAVDVDRWIVATYNVNFGAEPDTSAIAATGADVVVLQETTPAWEAAIRRDLADQYPYMAFRHCCRAGGLGLLSRTRFEEKEYLPSPVRWFPAWRFVVTSPVGEVQILDVHLHPPVTEGGNWALGWFTTGDERRREIEAHVAALDDGLPTIIAGDFNEPTDGAAWDFLHERGFRSALGAREPDRRTWRWPGPLGELSAQLDHVAHDARLKVVDARVLEVGPSDHFPVVVTFQGSP